MRSVHSSRALVVLVSTTAWLASTRAAAQGFAGQSFPVAGGLGTTPATELVDGDIDGDGDADYVMAGHFGGLFVVRQDAGSWTSTFVEQTGPGGGWHVADVNADGRADVLLAESFVSTQRGWRPGLPNGSLGAFVPFNGAGTNFFAKSQLTGDVTGDGKLDVIASVDSEVRVFGGNGFGTFSLAQTIALPDFAGKLAIGDVDVDGDLDVAAANSFPPTANVRLLVAQSGSLGPATLLALTGPVIASGDFDADGDADLAAFGLTGAAWMRGGAGGLTTGGNLALPGANYGAAGIDAADLNLDGITDLLLSDSNALGGEVHRSFGSAGTGLTLASAVLAKPAVAIRAFEWDGHPGLDLVTVGNGQAWAELFPGNGSGGFHAPLTLSGSNVCTDTEDFAVGDVDEDGRLDVTSENGTWLQGLGNGQFAPAAPLGARASELVDLDGDGRLDALSFVQDCGAESGWNFALQTASGFGPSWHPFQLGAGLSSMLAFGDIDADGDVDVATAGMAGVHTHLNLGPALWGPHQQTTLPAGTNLAVGDVNADGRADLACSRSSSPTGPFSGSLHWVLATGAGQFGPQQTLQFAGATVGPCRIDDFDCDGLVDVAWVHGSLQANIAAGNGSGGFALPATVPIAGSASISGMSALEAVDLDGDGQRELVAGGGGHPLVYVSRFANGVKTSLYSLANRSSVGRIRSGDFNADGRLDLCWGQFGLLQVQVELSPDPSGIASFGGGTGGCAGTATIGAFQDPQVGNTAFRVAAHGLPRSAPGWFALGTASAPTGTDPFGLGALLHVDPLASSAFQLFASKADLDGNASRAFPIPGDPLLAGAQVYTQALALGVGSTGDDCSAAAFGLVSSRGLAVTIQP